MSFPRYQTALPKASRRVQLGVLGMLIMLGSLLLANWATTALGFIPVGFGVDATAGTLVAGVALAARDLIQDSLGRVAVLCVILVGSVLSFAISAPEIALASAAAFLFAEMADFAAYTPIRMKAKFGDKRWAAAVIVSNLVGALADTVIFLFIAFGAASVLPAVPGQLVGKMWGTLAYLLIGAGIAYLLRRANREKVLGALVD